MVSNFGFLPMHKLIDSIIFVRIISLVGFLVGLTCYNFFLANYLTLAASSFVSSGFLISKLWFRIMLALKMYILVTLMVQVLAVNAAKDATDLVAKLRACHYAAQTKADKKHLSR